MKHIDYYGDLKKDIDTLNSDEFNMLDYIKWLVIFGMSVSLILAGVSYKTEFIDFTLKSFLFYLSNSAIAVSLGSGFLAARERDRNIYNDMAVADRVENLKMELERNDVIVDEFDIAYSEVSDDVLEKIDTFYEFQVNSTSVHKIINYFYLLDNKDKIRVLKQIKRVIKKRFGENETKYDLYLLNNEETSKMNLPVRRVLVRDDDE